MATVEISLAARTIFQQMRKDHLLEYCIYRLPENGTVLEVERCSQNDSFTLQNHLHAFATSLPPTQCRYAIYNFRFMTSEGGNMCKLIFVLWCPHEAGGSEREVYTDARPSVRRQLPGISCEVLAQTPDDLDFDVIIHLINP